VTLVITGNAVMRESSRSVVTKRGGEKEEGKSRQKTLEVPGGNRKKKVLLFLSNKYSGNC